MSEPMPASRWRDRLLMFWFWSINLLLIFIQPGARTAFQGVVVSLVAVPLVVAAVSAFTHPEWFTRTKNTLLYAVLWVGGALVYHILTTTGSWVSTLDEYVKEGRAENGPSIDHIITRMAQGWEQFTDGVMIVGLGVVALMIFMWLRGTPLSEIGEGHPEPRE